MDHNQQTKQVGGLVAPVRLGLQQVKWVQSATWLIEPKWYTVLPLYNPQ